MDNKDLYLLKNCLEKIGYFNFYNIISNMNANSNINVNDLINEYAIVFYKEFIKLDFKERLLIIDFLFNSRFKKFVELFLFNDNSIVYESILSYKILCGYNFDELKNNSNLNQSSSFLDDRIDKILGTYLNNITDKDCNELYSTLINKCSRFFCTIYKDLFNEKNSYLDAFNVLNILLSSKDVDYSYLQEIYDNVIKNDINFSSFNIDDAIYNRPELLYSIKGIIGSIDDEVLIELLNKDFSEEFLLNNGINSNNFIDMHIDLLKKIAKINIDNEDLLYSFFYKVSRYENNENKSLYDELKKQDFYLKYAKKQEIENIYNSMLDDALNEKVLNYENKLLYDFGKTDIFSQKREQILNLFVNSKDQEYKKTLIPALIICEISNLKERYNTSFTLKFSTDKQENNLFGSYNYGQNTLFINPFYINAISDADEALIECINTSAHEVRHAKQYEELRTAKFSFDQLIFSLDCLMSDIIGGFYDENYKYISTEQDANAIAYVDTMTYFKDFPSLLEKTKNNFYNKVNNNSNHIRTSTFIDNNRFSTIELFEREINFLLNIYKSMDKSNYENNLSTFQSKSQELLDYIKTYYPTIWLFFNYDEEKNKINLKSRDYFQDKFEEFECMPDCVEKDEGIFTLENIFYNLKVKNYLNTNFKNNIFSQERNKSFEELLEEVQENIGKSPNDVVSRKS